MKKLFFVLVLILLVPTNVLADEIEIDGLWYEIVSKTREAKVITYKSEKYGGTIIIPENVEFDGVNYNVTSIEDNAFYQCSDLISVTIPNCVKKIGWCAFYECGNLESAEIPNSVTNIGSQAFWGCRSLTSVVIPISVTRIDDYVFCDCRSPTSIVIPNSVTAIGRGAFQSCSSLSSVTIPNSVARIDIEAFRYCRSLTSITIPNSITNINEFAFEGCSSLTSVTIPNSVMSVGLQAFYGCSSLKTITIGNGVNTIFYHAFANCLELKDVYCYADIIPSMLNVYNKPVTSAFEGSLVEYATLHVPESSISDYKSTEPWSNFKSVVAIDGVPDTQKCATPTISYNNGKLKFDCDTEGVEFISEITDADIKKNYSSEIDLTATYFIRVHAIKSGYDNSDMATATLCWIDVEPKTEGIGNGIASVRANAILIQSRSNVLSITGAPMGSEICAYNLSGQKVGSAKTLSETTEVCTLLQTGEVGIVMVGQKAVKVVMK